MRPESLPIAGLPNFERWHQKTYKCFLAAPRQMPGFQAGLLIDDTEKNSMEYRVYSERVLEGSRLLDVGDLAGAVAVFDALASSEISDLDKSLMAHNAAVVCERMEQPDTAIAWYDYGIAYEQPYFRFTIAEKKAEYLARLGRNDESLALYENLLQQPYLMEHDKERVWNAISVLKRPRA